MNIAESISPEVLFSCLNGKTIHAQDKFHSKDGAVADCPGGFGVAGEDINCRCFLKYAFVLKSEFLAQGGVIPEEISGNPLTYGGDGGIIEEQERMRSSSDYAVPKDMVQSREFRMKFDLMDSDKSIQREYYKVAKDMLAHRSGTNGEDLYYYNTRLKKWYKSTTGTQAGTPDYTEEIIRGLNEAQSGDIVSFHNHPLGMPPSDGDLNAALKNGYQKCYTIGHDGTVFEYTAPKEFIPPSIYDAERAKYTKKGCSEFEAQLNTLLELKELFQFDFKEVK